MHSICVVYICDCVYVCSVRVFCTQAVNSVITVYMVSTIVLCLSIVTDCLQTQRTRGNIYYSIVTRLQ